MKPLVESLSLCDGQKEDPAQAKLGRGTRRPAPGYRAKREPEHSAK
jgi:hypothetical protein